MGIHLIDMVLSGLVYVILVYFMMRMLHRKTKSPRRDDDDDGGINIDLLPKIDLPPGVTWPDGSPGVNVEKPEFEEAL